MSGIAIIIIILAPILFQVVMHGINTKNRGENCSTFKLKSTTGWNSPRKGATNISDFGALPGGNRSADGLFHHLGDNADSIGFEDSNRLTGRSVRCVKD